MASRTATLLASLSAIALLSTAVPAFAGELNFLGWEGYSDASFVK